jgi:hypothetical protein
VAVGALEALDDVWMGMVLHVGPFLSSGEDSGYPPRGIADCA